MRKQQKLDLELLLRGLSIICPEHQVACFRHMSGDGPENDAFYNSLPMRLTPEERGLWPNEGCWDCLVPHCDHHVHENPNDSARWGDRLIPEHVEAARLKREAEVIVSEPATI